MKKSFVFASVTVIGVALIVLGFLMFHFLAPVAARTGLLATWILAWLIITSISLGTLTTFRLPYSPKSLLLAFVLLILWSTIFFIPLPDNSQNLLAVIIAFVSVLLYRYYNKRKHLSQENNANKD